MEFVILTWNRFVDLTMNKGYLLIVFSVVMSIALFVLIMSEDKILFMDLIVMWFVGISTGVAVSNRNIQKRLARNESA